MSRRWITISVICLLIVAAVSLRTIGQGTEETMATGYGYVTMGWLPEAVRLFAQAAREHPDDMEAVVTAGIGYKAIGHDRQAESLLSRGARLENGLPELWALVGDIRLSLGDVSGATDAFRRALDYDDELALAHRGLGVIAERQGDTQQAVRHYEDALEASPGLVPVRVQLARLLIADEAWEEAREHLELVLRMQPRDAEVHWLLAQAYLGLGESPRAMHMLTRALQLDPNHRAAAAQLEELQRQ